MSDVRIGGRRAPGLGARLQARLDELAVGGRGAAPVAAVLLTVAAGRLPVTAKNIGERVERVYARLVSSRTKHGLGR